MLRTIVTLLLVLCPGYGLGRLEAQEVAASSTDCVDRARSSPSARVMVLLETAVTDSALAELERYGVVHGWIDRYRLVAMTPGSPADRGAVATLPLVRSVENDSVICPASVASWNLDLIDVMNVEESGFVGEPDPREVKQTGAGVHVAILDSGLTPGWRNVLPEERVAVDLARAFIGGGPPSGGTLANEFNVQSPPGLWEQDSRGHGLGVSTMVIGFKYGGLLVDGSAPGAKVIPLRVADESAVSFASHIVAAFDYLITLVESHAIGPVVANLSLIIVDGSVAVNPSSPNPVVERAIDDAIAAGILVVAAAGNSGEFGMTWPGAYPQVISAGAVGWTRQYRPVQNGLPNNDFWWTQDVGFDPDPRRGPTEASESYVAGFSSRATPERGQQLDVLAPGALIAHTLDMRTFSGLVFGFGTSLASPLTAGVVALMLEVNPRLTQAQAETILKSTALPLKSADSRSGVFDFGAEQTISWDTDCAGVACDAVGAGLIQADAAIAATPKR
jgi:subtilisin family serine protease